MGIVNAGSSRRLSNAKGWRGTASTIDGGSEWTVERILAQAQCTLSLGPSIFLAELRVTLSVRSFLSTPAIPDATDVIRFCSGAQGCLPDGIPRIEPWQRGGYRIVGPGGTPDAILPDYLTPSSGRRGGAYGWY